MVDFRLMYIFLVNVINLDFDSLKVEGRKNKWQWEKKFEQKKGVAAMSYQ